MAADAFHTGDVHALVSCFTLCSRLPQFEVGVGVGYSHECPFTTDQPSLFFGQVLQKTQNRLTIQQQKQTLNNLPAVRSSASQNKMLLQLPLPLPWGGLQMDEWRPLRAQ